MRARSFVLASVLFARAALAQEKGPCDLAYEQGQEARNKGHLLTARAKFVECSHPMCPSFEQSDCAKWLGEVRRAIPTVTIDAAGAHATLDGSEAITTPTEVDSGDHVLRCERAGAAVVTQRFTITPAEKSKSVTCPPADVVKPIEPVTPIRTSPFPAIVVGTMGLALLAGGITLDAVVYENDVLLLQKCTPGCLQNDVDAARVKLIAGDVIAGVGLVVVGIATYLFFSRPTLARVSARGLVFAF